ncbi:DUF2785 domain-containing protein [Nonomuraea sp. NPDC050310]|uniref:DUF2785 domain-containing protein n=1 Tax=unclassified Nonomuraea TaxID=2593643 RepID=UPI0033E0EA4D
MTDWEAVRANDCVVPADRPFDELVEELVQAVRDPDPIIRDGHAYAVLSTWIERDVIDAERRAKIGSVMAARFDDHEIQARTFAPLILDMIVSKGDYASGWEAAFTRWFPAEADVRGYDERLGWLHAVAHGADLLGTFGQHPAVRPAAMLELAAARLLAPTAYVFAQQEDERLAQAIARCLTRPELTVVEALGWLETVAADLAALPRGPIPAHAANTIRTLRVLYILAGEGVRTRRDATPVALPHGAAIKEKLGSVLAEHFQYA